EEVDGISVSYSSYRESHGFSIFLTISERLGIANGFDLQVTVKGDGRRQRFAGCNRVHAERAIRIEAGVLYICDPARCGPGPARPPKASSNGCLSERQLPLYSR